MGLVIWVLFAKLGVRETCIALGLELDVKGLLLGSVSGSADAQTLDCEAELLMSATTTLGPRGLAYPW